MHLVEVMVAGVIWSGALGAGFQLSSRGATLLQRNQQMLQVLEVIERDRLQLQVSWREHRTPEACLDDAHFEPQVNDLPMPTGIRRVVKISEREGGALVEWWQKDSPVLLRKQLFTSAGLGLCQLG